jgi:hypothetical protein
MEQKFYISRELNKLYKCGGKPRQYNKLLHRVSADEFLEFLLINYKNIEGLQNKSAEELRTIVDDDCFYIWNLKAL